MDTCWEDEFNKNEDAYFYSISCPWNKTEDRLLYLGMTFQQEVWTRMNQHGIKLCQKAYPKKSKNLIVSGVLGAFRLEVTFLS